MLQDYIDAKLTLAKVMAWCLHIKAITWINADQYTWCHMVAPGHNELIIEACDILYVSVILLLLI